ncbi:MAG: pyridoxamine 5'-phosphate oxidase family protein, partial [Bdellovibrionota bacterium]
MENEMENNSDKDIKKLGEMIKGIKIAMLTTVDMDGNLYSRPMMTQEAEFDGTIWFFTSRSSGKIYSMRNDVHVNLSYANTEDNRYVSI